MAHPGGRPTKYTPEMVDLICERVATHGMGLRRLCNMYDDMPEPETLNVCRYKYPEFSERYLAARSIQAHILFETSLDDIDEIKDYRYTDKDSGAVKVDPGMVAAQKALANHKTFMAAKIQPLHYGTKEVIDKSSDETLSKIQALVADINKTNISDV